jgi:hypothetical protein
MPTGEGTRPSVCYLVAGHNLLSTAGPSRNVLSLARALSEFADVTVAFRRVLEPVEGEPFTALEIEPGGPEGAPAVDDAAMRGIGWLEFAGYLRALDRFAERHLAGFDVVLEKSWLLTGYVSSWCRDRGIAGVPVVNVVPVVRQVLGNPAKVAKNWVARGLSGRYLRRAPRLIAESDDLKASIAQRWRVPHDRIEVIGLDRRGSTDGADAARRQAGIAPDRTAMYVGALFGPRSLADHRGTWSGGSSVETLGQRRRAPWRGQRAPRLACGVPRPGAPRRGGLHRAPTSAWRPTIPPPRGQVGYAAEGPRVPGGPAGRHRLPAG